MSGLELAIGLGALAVLVVLLVCFVGTRQVRAGTAFGSAQFADDGHISAAGLVSPGGFPLGYRSTWDGSGRHAGFQKLTYAGDRHRLVAAPARSGKFVSCVGPLLLDDVDASALVLDVKGEAAYMTGAWRKSGGSVFLLNPFNLWKLGTDGYNPMRLLAADGEGLIGDARLLVDAFIEAAAGNADRHFEEEGKNLVLTFVLYVATAPEEAARRTLNRVRTLLTLVPEEFEAALTRMSQSDLAHGAVRQGANVFLQKADRERSGVLSTAHRMTSFLMDPEIKDVLKRDSFRFGDLKRRVGTVYLIIPPSRLKTHSAFLRLMITAALIEFERVPLAAGAKSVRVVLDEFPLIGRLKVIEEAYSVQAGFGVQFHVIAQNFNQLKETYGPFWETFVSSAGVIQVFDTNDSFSAEYISKLIGDTTVLAESYSSSSSSGGKGGGSSSQSLSPTRRRLLTPDEVRRLSESNGLVDGEFLPMQLIIPNAGSPVRALRWIHYKHDPFASRTKKAPRL